MPFVKLDCGMLNSSLWPDADARIIFITSLLMATPHEYVQPEPQLDVRTMKESGWLVPPGWYGMVQASGVGIIHRCGLEKEAGMAALERLGKKDDDSRSDDFEGRRLVRVDGGYIVLNFQKYRDRDYTGAERQQRFRDRQKQSQRNGVTSTRNGVTGRNITQAEAEAEAEAHTHKRKNSFEEDLPHDQLFARVGHLKRNLCRWFGLPDERQWPNDEERLMPSIVQRSTFEADLMALNHYHARANGYFPKSTRSLIEKWDHHVQVAGKQETERPMRGPAKREHVELTDAQVIAIARGEMKDPNYD